MMKKSIATLALLVAAASTQAGLLSDRWIKVDKWEDALAAAKKADRPIAILYGFEGGYSWRHGHAMDYFMAERSLDSFVRVVNYCEDSKGPARNYFGLAEGTNGMVPELYFVDPKTERLVGFVDYRKTSDTAKIARHAATVIKWRAGVDKDITRADRAAEQGRFKEAFRILKDVPGQDAKTSKAVETQLGVEYDPDRRPATNQPNRRDDAGVGSNDKDPKRPAADDSGNDSNTDDKKDDANAKATFFPGLADKKRAEYGEMASKRLTNAKVELEQKQYVKARAFLQPMIADGSDLPQVAEAKTLLAEINAAEKAARPAPAVR